MALKAVGSNPITHPIKQNTKHSLGVLFYGVRNGIILPTSASEASSRSTFAKAKVDNQALALDAGSEAHSSLTKHQAFAWCFVLSRVRNGIILPTSASEASSRSTFAAVKVKMDFFDSQNERTFLYPKMINLQLYIDFFHKMWYNFLYIQPVLLSLEDKNDYLP